MIRIAVSTLALAAAPTAAMADPGRGWQMGPGPMMMSGGYGLVGGVMMLVLWAAVIALIVFAIKWLADSQGGRRGRRDAMDLLRQRFAAGEIDEEEFKRRRKALES